MVDLAPLTFGRVVGRYLAHVEDGVDVGSDPDGEPMSGRITFTMSSPSVLVSTAVPDPATIFLRRVVVDLDSDGYISSQGARGVSLLATDDPATIPTDMQWEATFDLTLDGRVVYYAPIPFELPAGSEVDLTLVTPLAEPAPNTIITKGDPGVPVEIGSDGTYMQWRYVGTTEWFNIIALADLPAGAPGAQVELGTSATHIQWRYDNEVSWTDLVALADLKGEQGDQGVQGVQGEVGPEGPEGPQGPQGIPGADGTDAETASNAETQAMTDSVKHVTPAGLGAASSSTYSGNYGRLVRYDPDTGRFTVEDPTSGSHPATKNYVDDRAVRFVTSQANLDAFMFPTAYGKVATGNLATYTGLAEMGSAAGTYLFENHIALDGANYFQRQVIYSAPAADGSVRAASRSRTLVAFAGTWSAWALVEPGGGEIRYPNVAALDSITTTQRGMVRLREADDLTPNVGGYPFNADYLGSDAWVETRIGNDFNGPSGNWPDEPSPGSGGAYQTLQFTDGYLNFTAYRYRAFNGSTDTWGSWNSWDIAPIPDRAYRPSARALWRSGPLVTDDAYVRIVDGATSPSSFALADPASVDHIFLTSPHEYAMEGGKLQMKSAGYEFQGILDGAITDYGTRDFVARVAGAANLTSNSRVEWTAPSSASDAVAGFTLPLGSLNYLPGSILHMTFMLSGGITSTTRLLGGICRTADLAEVMADIDPSAIANQDRFYGAGHGASDANYSVFGGGVGAAVQSLGVAVSDLPNRRVDLKLFNLESDSTQRGIAAITGHGTAAITRLANRIVPHSLGHDLSIFLRASAGGTAAQPKVSLLRLKFGHGFGIFGGAFY